MRKLVLAGLTVGMVLGGLELLGRALMSVPSSDPKSDAGRSVAMLYTPGPSPVVV